MGRITKLNILQEFSDHNGEVCGIYWGKFREKKRLFVRQGDKVFILGHYTCGPSLDLVRDDVRDELFALTKCQNISKV